MGRTEYKRKEESMKKKTVLQKIKNIPGRIDREIEKRKYIKNQYGNILQIRNPEESLQYIKDNKISFYRYGDAEIAVMQGMDVPFQKADPELGRRLLELLNLEEEGIEAAIPYYYLNYEQGMNPFIEEFTYAMKRQRKFLISHCRKDKKYLDTALSQVYQTYENYDFDKYFAKLVDLIKDRDVVLICGKGILKDIQYNPFDLCKSIEYIEAPNISAFSEYDSILAEAKKVSKDKLICIILGPTADLLVYDLFKEGYQAWDIGHFVKDYDAYHKKNPRNADSLVKFYAPD